MIVGVQPLAGFDKLLHYRVPETLRADVRLGSLVRVPILNRSHLGLVLEVDAVPDCAPAKLKAVSAVLHGVPALTPDLLELARWMHTYYAARMESVLEAMIPALVLERGDIDGDGTRHFLLRLADRTGGRELWGVTLKEATLFPDVGDLVGFRIVKIASDLPVEVSIIGFIAVKLAPEFLEKKGWRVEANYTPKNIRPAIHW